MFCEQQTYDQISIYKISKTLIVNILDIFRHFFTHRQSPFEGSNRMRLNGGKMVKILRGPFFLKKSPKFVFSN
jgi:hypothetical protein